MRKWFPAEIREIPAFLGPKLIRLIWAFVLVGIVLVGVEFGMSLLLQFVLVGLGLVKPSLVPDWLAPYATEGTIIWVLAPLVIIGFFRMIGFFSLGFFLRLSQEIFGLRMRMMITYDMLYSDQRDFVGATDTNHRLAELLPKVQSFLITALNSIVYGLITVALFLAMFFVAPKETLVCMGGLGVIGLLTMILNRIARPHSRRTSEHYRDLQRYVDRGARNWLFLRISRMQHREFQNVLTSLSSYFESSVRAFFWSCWGSNFSPFVGVLLLAFVLWMSQVVFATPSLTLLVFLYLFVRFIQQLRIFLSSFVRANEFSPQMLALFRLYQSLGGEKVAEPLVSLKNRRIWQIPFLLPEQASQDPHQDREAYQQAPQLLFQNIDFAYQEGSDPIFSDFSWKVKAGSQVGIMGPSGSGKSTLMGLMLANYVPQQGEVLIDEYNARDFFNSYALPMGYVGPEPFLIEGTLRENLLYGVRRDCSDGDLWEVLRLVELEATVQALPGHLEYELAENLEGLSTGQKQRLSLARALLSRPLLLLLDEVSANLDSKTEKQIAAALAKLKGECTVCIISHREGILEHADEVIHLQPLQERMSSTAPAFSEA